MSIHQCRESTDPRHAGYCPCGQVIVAAPEFHPRNPDLERDLIEQACRGRVDPGSILEAMQRRASKSEHGGDRLRVGVDWLLEASQEPPDGCNYIIWGWLAHLAELDTDSQANLMLALMELASAFNRVELVRARLKGYEND